jgi:Cd2+/Zn2+-exporting ATPase
MAKVDIVKNTETVFRIQGMDCASCARSIETGVRQLNGVQACELNFTTEKLRIVGNTSRQDVIDRVRELGYDVTDAGADDASLATGHTSTNFLYFLWQRSETRLALLGAGLILPGLIFEEILNIQHVLVNLASLAALTSAGLPVARNAWRSIRINREININVLMTIAALGAVVIGAYTEAGMVMVLFALGESLEGYTSSRARHSIRSLMQVVPNEATRLHHHGQEIHETQVKVEDLRVGDVIVVKPGERIPMDGLVRSGSSAINQASITGESKLIEKMVGSKVFASSMNGEGVLEIEITSPASDNTISRLIKMVEEAQEKRAPSQRFIDRFAKYYTPAVVILAILVATIPPLFLGQPFWNPNPDTLGWLYRGLALLVVACPCALVISTPVSIISAISNGAGRGVIIKGGAYLEMLNSIKAVALDKTGTLTTGKPNVVALRAAACEEINPSPIGNCGPCSEILALASAVERRSEHPLAHAITLKATQQGLHGKYPVAEMIQAVTGKGVVGQVNGQNVLIGSHTYFDAAIPHSQTDCRAAHNDAQDGLTPLMVGRDDRYLGTITVADTVRESSAEAMAMLKQLGLERLVMLTGDDQAVATTIAEEVGVTDIRAELLPENKVKAIRELQHDYGPVAMVGDGINDAPALATAEVGLAIGVSHNTQAMETADVILMGDNLRQLAFIFNLSRATMQTIHRNVILSIGIKAVFLILVLLGMSTMWMAVLADMGTSLLVTLNGMRLLRYKSTA